MSSSKGEQVEQGKGRFRRREEVDAIRWTGNNIAAVMDFMAPHKPVHMAAFSNADDLVGLPGGVANKGDWILRRADSTEIWPLTSDEFEAQYEPV